MFGRTCQKFLDLELLSLSLSLSIVMLFQSCSLPDSLHLLLVYLSIYTFVLSSILLYVHSSSVLCTSAYISCFLYLPTYLPTYSHLPINYLLVSLSILLSVCVSHPYFGACFFFPPLLPNLSLLFHILFFFEIS